MVDKNTMVSGLQKWVAESALPNMFPKQISFAGQTYNIPASAVKIASGIIGELGGINIGRYMPAIEMIMPFDEDGLFDEDKFLTVAQKHIGENGKVSPSHVTGQQNQS